MISYYAKVATSLVQYFGSDNEFTFASQIISVSLVYFRNLWKMINRNAGNPLLSYQITSYTTPLRKN